MCLSKSLRLAVFDDIMSAICNTIERLCNLRRSQFYSYHASNSFIREITMAWNGNILRSAKKGEDDDDDA